MKISADKSNDSIDTILHDINGWLMKTILAKIGSARNSVKLGGQWV